MQTAAPLTGSDSSDRWRAGFLLIAGAAVLSSLLSASSSASIFIFPRAAALTFSTEKLTVFRDSLGSAALLCPVRKRCHEREVMSGPLGCLLNLRRHYFTTQHDCIHIIPHPAKVASKPLAWRPCAQGDLGGLGCNQRERDRDPSAFSCDGQSNKARS